MGTAENFEVFGFDPLIYQAVKEAGYVVPTPIQQKAIPLVMQGIDVMGAAQTGTGKTAGFGLPLIQRLLRYASTSTSPARHPVRALILEPTRELACQVSDSLAQYSSHTKLSVGVVYGGVDIKTQTVQLKKGLEILVATPGRLLDHLEQRNTNLNNVEVVVLDEADRMLDMGFLPDITRILQKVPQTHQSLMFSATFSPEIKKLAKSFLNNPTVIEVSRKNKVADNIAQEVFLVKETQKTDALVELLNEYKTNDQGEIQQAIIFVNAKITARQLARQLTKFGFSADSIHGDRVQEERTQILQNFKDKVIQFLVATDVAARGLDISEMPFVFNYDVPFVAEDYVHRIGRTGRAGASGKAITLMCKDDERSMSAIETLIKRKFDKKKLNPPEAKYPKYQTGKTYVYVPPEPANNDPLFSQPYVPEENPSKPRDLSLKEPVVTKTTKRAISTLLGGSGKKREIKKQRGL